MTNIPGHELFANFHLYAKPEGGITTVNIHSYLDSETPFDFIGTNTCPDLRIVLSGLDFVKRDISGFDWQGITLKDCRFTNCFTKRRINSWDGAELDNVRFQGKFRGNLVVKIDMYRNSDPEGRWPARTLRFHEKVETALDLSDVQFDRFPKFRGIPVEKIKRGSGMFVKRYDKIDQYFEDKVPKSMVETVLKQSLLLRKTGTDIFIVPLLAKDASQHLEDCMELVELGLLSE